MAKNVNVEINNDVQKAIDNYSSRIVTMKDFVSSVRQATGMYIGFVDERGYINMTREIFQNAVDQVIEPKSPCTTIFISFNEITKRVIVEDFGGLGLPFNDMVRILTTQHTSKNYKKELYNFPSGLHGVGAKITNALSEEFIAESYHYSGEARRLVMKEGYPTTKEPVSIPNKEKKQGTKIEFVPSRQVFGDRLDVPYTKIYKLVKRINSLCPIGSTVIFEGIDSKGEKHTETIVNKDGIITELICNVKRPLIAPVVYGDNSNGELKIDVAFCYDMQGSNPTSPDIPDSQERVTSFSNFCPTLSGTHVDGTVKGICQWFTDYMNKIYLANQKGKIKLKVTPADIKCGLNVMISAACIDPHFSSQAKEILSNPEMEVYAKRVAMQGLDEWSKRCPQDLAKLSKFFKDMCEVRQKAEGDKVKITTKYVANSTTGLPAKYAKPIGKGPFELLICEGDSAGGQVKQARNKYTQGVFPIRGKIPNAFDTPFQKLFSNPEIQGITRIIFGCDYKKTLTLEDCKIDKIIFLADSDIDGNHINSLLLRFFVLYFPFLIEAGRVYHAVPPLFGMKKNGKMTYFNDRLDMIKYVQKEFSKNNTISLGKSILSSKELTVLLSKNVDYVYEMEKVSNRYAVDPYLLELILVDHLNNKNSKALQKDIKSKYRFMNVTDKKGTSCIEGVIGQKYQTLYFNDKLIADCKDIIRIIESNDQVYYNLNGQDSSLYSIMKLFDNSMPTNLNRYKGLGEMGLSDLADSTLLDDRTLVRYTIDDVKETIEAIRALDSDKKQILRMIDKVSRAELQG